MESKDSVSETTDQPLLPDRRLLVAILGLLVLVVVANNSAGSLAQPLIGEAFGAGPADVGWIVFGFGAAFAIGTAVWGGIATRAGIGPSLGSGVALFVAGSALAAVAPSLPVLIAARLLQGFGSGAIPTLSTALIARRFEAAERSRALGVIVASVGTGLALGPLLGGLAIEALGWRAAVAFGFVAIPAIPLVARADTARDPAHSIDLPGAFLVALLALSGAFLVNRAPVIGPSIPVVAAAAALVVAAIGLAMRARTVRHAFLPAAVIGDPAFWRLTLLGAIGMSAFLGTLVAVPVGVSRAYGLGGLALGLVLLPMAVSAAAASISNARVQAALGPTATSILSLGSIATGAVAIAVVAGGGPPLIVAVALIPIGLGFGLLSAPLLALLTQHFSGSLQPVAVGAFNLFFFLGASLGAALSSAFLQTGVELPLFGARTVPGFATAELLLAIVPALAALALLLGRRIPSPGVAET